MIKIPTEVIELRDELIAARKLIENGKTRIITFDTMFEFQNRFPCAHLSVTEYIHKVFAATRDQPAEYGGYAICNECGERLDLDDVLSYAERIEGKQ
jgi:hypothetical protein